MKRRWRRTGALVAVAGALFFLARHLEVRWLAQAEAEAVPRAPQALIDAVKTSAARAIAKPGIVVATKPVAAKTVSGKTAPDKLTPEQLYCLMKDTGVDMSGETRFSSTVLWDGSRNFGMITMVTSKACPRGSYSIVRFDARGRHDKTMDCRTTPLAQLELEYGRQWNVVDATPADGAVDFAISGGGYFVKHCGEAGVMITRDGRFHYNEEGLLVDESGACEVRSTPTAAEPQGGPITIDDGDFDQEGCQQGGHCVSVIDPILHGSKNYTHVDDRHMRGPESALSRPRIGGLHLFLGSYEDLDDPSRNSLGTLRAEEWESLQQEPDCRGFRADLIDWGGRPSYASE